MGKDFFGSMAEWLHERATSPILSTFTAMWIVFNYKAVIVLISSNSYLKRFEFLDSYILFDKFYIYRLILPVVFTGLYLRFYPILRNFIYDYWSLQQVTMDEIKVKNFKLKTISEEEKLKLIQEIVDWKNKYEIDIKERDELIELQNKEINSLKSEHSSTPSPANSNETHEILLLILGRLVDNKSAFSFNSDQMLEILRDEFGVNSIDFKKALRMGVVSNFIKLDNTSHITITAKGKEYFNK